MRRARVAVRRSALCAVLTAGALALGCARPVVAEMSPARSLVGSPDALGFGELIALERTRQSTDRRDVYAFADGPIAASGGSYAVAPIQRGVLGYAVTEADGTAPIVDLVERRIAAANGNARGGRRSGELAGARHLFDASSPDAERARAFLEPGPGRIALHVLARRSDGAIRLATSEDDVAHATGVLPPPLIGEKPEGENEYSDLGVVGYLVPYFEVGEPTALARADGRPRGLMIVIHGGGWQSDGEESVTAEPVRAEVERWRARGWRTVAISYGSSREGPPELWPLAKIGWRRPVVQGSQRRSIEDVLWFYDRLRAAYGADLPICATGWSAGGHLALLLAAARPDVACVVGEAAPTDLPALVAANGDGGRAAEFAFGAAAASEHGNGLSPVDLASALHARILLATATKDRWVPVAQMTALRDALQRSGGSAELSIVELQPGPLRFWHTSVSEASLAEFYARESEVAAAVEH